LEVFLYKYLFSREWNISPKSGTEALRLRSTIAAHVISKSF